MKTLKKCIFYLLATLLLTSCGDKPVVEANYAVIPLPQNIEKTGDNIFKLDGSTRIVYPVGNDLLKQNAQFLSDFIYESAGLKLSVTEEGLAENAIILTSNLVSDNAEAYSIGVSDKLIVIDGASEAGTFYGIQTLRKSIPANEGSSLIEFPTVRITDEPRFGYRGMMLDVGRHFFSVKFIKKYIDILALHNINRFHWHLTEDQGWRIEIKKYPKLTKIGSQREQTVIGRNSGEFDGKPYGGFYTQEQVKEVVDYAQKRFITIVPEIDLPGHMLAALASYPELGCTGGPYKVGQQWGVYDDVLCAGNDRVYTFLEDIFGELIELFPSEYIHIGGDECPKVRWKECPKCQTKIKELGIKADALHSKEDKLQSFVISHVEKFLNSKGRKIIGWDEILEGGLAPNATVMSWRGIDGGVIAAKQGHDVIMSPNSHLYFDHYQSNHTQDEPLAIGGYLPIEKVYSFEPFPEVLNDSEKKHIIGVQANEWTEYMPTSEQVEYMLMPRVAALSEVQWTEADKKNYPNFLSRLEGLMKQYDRLGYKYATTVTDIQSTTENDTSKGFVLLTLFTYDNAPIYYTTDGSKPSENNTLYTKPIEIDKSVEIKALAFRDHKHSKLYTNGFNFNKATLKSVRLENEPHRNYKGQGVVTLVDGKRGTNSFANGEWLGFAGKDFVATVDLNVATEVSEVRIGTYLGANSWIFGATGYSVSVSDDGKSFKEVFSETYPVLKEHTPNDTLLDLVAKFEPVNARFVRVIANVTPAIPDWHQGKGNPAFIFVDEIIIQ